MKKKCPACSIEFDAKSNDVVRKQFQHHLRLGHNVEVIRSHVLSQKWSNSTLSVEDIDEIKQMRLPI